jgi:hypothetical protein
MRSAAASAHFDHRSNFSAEIEVVSERALTASTYARMSIALQRNGFIKQAIDLCMFNSLSMFLLFAFDLQFAFASILFQCCFASYAPLKFVDTAFAVTDLGGGYDLHSDLKLAPSSVLPGRPILTVVSGKDSEAQLVRVWRPLGGLTPSRWRSIERQGHSGLMDGDADVPRFSASNLGFAAASG